MSSHPGFTPESAAFWLAAGLIRQAARGAPPVLAERLEEEWLADLAAQPSGFAALHFALGCCLATCVIAREHRFASATVISSLTSANSLSPGQPRSPSMNNTRMAWHSAAFTVVVSLAVSAFIFINTTVHIPPVLLLSAMVLFTVGIFAYAAWFAHLLPASPRRKALMLLFTAGAAILLARWLSIAHLLPLH
jgi:hypothetical protein